MHSAVNWNVLNDNFTQMFWEQNIKQFWVDSEIPISKDKKDWVALTKAEQKVYKKALAGLTLLDTEQGNVGMPSIMRKVEDMQQKAVLMFMGAMEEIHAKSYSAIFTTLLDQFEIKNLFNWVEGNDFLQRKAELVNDYYNKLTKDNSTKKDLYMAMTASVFLESFLFYSGFFYPLYLAGQGKMTASGEIINLIIRDESIHGVFVGLLAQNVYKELNEEQKEQVDKETNELLVQLMGNELCYTEYLYSDIGIDNDVKAFLYYNANKALMNLGKEPYYEEREVNPIVINGLSTETKTHDFFSVKGNGYQKGKYEDLTDDDFKFDF